jgi:hypothetical protein
MVAEGSFVELRDRSAPGHTTLEDIFLHVTAEAAEV